MAISTASTAVPPLRSAAMAERAALKGKSAEWDSSRERAACEDSSLITSIQVNVLILNAMISSASMNEDGWYF